MSSSWLTRPNDTKIIDSCKVTYLSANTNYANVRVVPPWGGSYSMYLTAYGAILTKYSSDGKSRFDIGYKDYWDTSTGFAIEIFVRYFPPSVSPDPKPEEVKTPKAQIMSNHSDKLGYSVGNLIRSECVVKNIGGAGTIHVKVGVGYIDSSNMIFLTGNPMDDQLFLNYNQSYTFKQTIGVDITDYYRQEGVGWAYLKQQMYLFFLVGHKVSGDIIWDTERHIKIYLSPIGGEDSEDEFVDPTDFKEVIDDIIPGTGDIIDKVVDIVIPEPKPEGEPVDIMTFIYIGFAGLIGYMLIRSR